MSDTDEKKTADNVPTGTFAGRVLKRPPPKVLDIATTRYIPSDSAAVVVTFDDNGVPNVFLMPCRGADPENEQEMLPQKIAEGILVKAGDSMISMDDTVEEPPVITEMRRAINAYDTGVEVPLAAIFAHVSLPPGQHDSSTEAPVVCMGCVAQSLDDVLRNQLVTVLTQALDNTLKQMLDAAPDPETMA